MGLHCPRTRPLSTLGPSPSDGKPYADGVVNHNTPFFSNHLSMAEVTSAYFVQEERNSNRTMPGSYVTDSPNDTHSPLPTPSNSANASLRYNRSTSNLVVQRSRGLSASLFNTTQSQDYTQSRASSMESIVYSASNNATPSKGSPNSSPCGTMRLSMATTALFMAQAQGQPQTQSSAPTKRQHLRRTHRVIRISSLDVSIIESHGEPDINEASKFEAHQRVPDSPNAAYEKTGCNSTPGKQQSWPDTSSAAAHQAVAADLQSVRLGTIHKRPVRKQVRWDLNGGSNDVDDGDLMDVDSGYGLGCSKWRA